MTDLRPRRPSPALIVAILALMVALGGSAFAASYVITSSKEIKPRVITGKHVKKGTLRRANFAPDALTGDITVRKVEGTIPAGGIETLKANCESGEKATGGGYEDAGPVVVASRPEPETGTPHAWVVKAYDASFPPSDAEQPIYVVCAK